MRVKGNKVLFVFNENVEGGDSNKGEDRNEEEQKEGKSVCLIRNRLEEIQK